MVFFFSESLLNIKEDLRAKHSGWYNVGWMPIIDEGKSCRPGQGFINGCITMIVMRQEMCVFTRNAGDIIFALSSKTQTPVSFFSVIIMQYRYAMGLEQH